MRDSRSVLLPTRESEMGPRSAGSYCDLVRPSFPSSLGSRAPTPSLLSSLTGWAPPATGSCACPAAPCISGPAFHYDIPRRWKKRTPSRGWLDDDEHYGSRYDFVYVSFGYLTIPSGFVVSCVDTIFPRRTLIVV